MRFELLVLDGSDKRYQLPQAGDVLVGSAAECAIRLTAGDVSRRHALLTLRRGTVSLLDLGSKNGTFVAGHRIKETLVKAGDLVRFSSVLTQLMPLGSSSDSAGDHRPPEETSRRARATSPTDEIEAVEDGSSIVWLLARWGRDGASGAGAALEWISRQAGARGTAILRLSDADPGVVAACGEVGSVLGNPALPSTLRRAAVDGRSVEAVPIEGDRDPILAIRCAESHWLLLVVGDANPPAGQMELFAQVVAVALRLDG